MRRVLTTTLDSSSIAKISYVPASRLLEVTYRRTGHIYDYFDVPRATYKELMAADSKGVFISEVIKPNFEYARAEFPVG